MKMQSLFESPNNITTKSIHHSQEILSGGKKLCSNCKEVKPLSSYWLAPNTKSGRRHSCIQCERTKHTKRSKEARARINEYVKDYQKTERGRLSNKLSNLARYNRAIRHEFSLDTFIEWFNSFEKCVLCNVSVKDSALGERHIDHILPVSSGGLTTKSNLQILCKMCNLSKPIKHSNTL